MGYAKQSTPLRQFTVGHNLKETDMNAKRTLTYISYVIAGLTFVSTIISISDNNIYQDGEWANAQWLGQDIVTFLVALPFLMISFKRGIVCGDSRWGMVYSGILLYYAYSYSFFMFAADLTILYLLQFPIFGLSVFGFVISLMRISNKSTNYLFEEKGLKVVIVTYLLAISLMISFLWFNDIFAHLSDPEYISDTPNGKAPLIIYSLDLAIVIPLMIISAILFYKKAKWGYILNGIILTKTSTLGFALMAMSISMYVQGLNPDYFLIVLWSVIGIIGTMLTILYLNKVKIRTNTVLSNSNQL